MIVVIVLSFIIFHLLLFRGTIFGLSLKNKTFGGFLLAREIYFFVIVGVVLFNQFGPYATNRFFYITKESIAITEFYILYSLFFFVLTIGVLSKTLFKKHLVIAPKQTLVTDDSRKLHFIILLLLIFLACFFYLGGMRHAFVGAVLFDGDLMTYRLHNSNGTSIPTVLMSLYDFMTILFAISVGVSSARMSGFKIFIYVFFILFFASFMGGKAPVVRSLILFFLAYVSLREFSSREKVKIAIFGGVASFLLLFLVVSTQFSTLTLEKFFRFIYLRLGTGQVQGTYEQFALQLKDMKYLWHGLPLSHFFSDVSSFNKDLMMNTYGMSLDSAKDTGVMNSFFIGEALAIGGIQLVLLSPFIVGINYILIYVMTFKLFLKYFKINTYVSRFYIQLLIPSYVVLTGDFTGFIFGKLLLMVFTFLTVLFIFDLLFRSLVLLPSRPSS